MAIFTIYFTEIEELKRKVNILKDGHTDSGQEHLRVQQELDALQIRQDNIKTELSLLVQTDDSKLRKVSATASDTNLDLADTVVNNDLYSEINESADVRRDSDKSMATTTVDTTTVAKDKTCPHMAMENYADKTRQCKESLEPNPSIADDVTEHKVDKQTGNRKVEQSKETAFTATIENTSTKPHLRFASEQMGATGGNEEQNKRTDAVDFISNIGNYSDHYAGKPSIMR